VAVNELEREAVKQRKVDVALLEIDKRNSALVAQRLEGRFFRYEAGINGGHVEARSFRPVDPQLRKLLRRDQPAFDEN
jgi:hypothetical protein